MNFKTIIIYILLFFLLIACKRKENTVLEQIYLTNFFHGERIIVDSLFLSGELLSIQKQNIFVIEGLPNHKEPVQFKIESIQEIDSKLKVQLDPFQKVLGGGLFNKRDNDFFHLSDSLQEKWLKRCFLNNMNFYFGNDSYHKVSVSNTSSVFVSTK